MVRHTHTHTADTTASACQYDWNPIISLSLSDNLNQQLCWHTTQHQTRLTDTVGLFMCVPTAPSTQRQQHWDFTWYQSQESKTTLEFRLSQDNDQSYNNLKITLKIICKSGPWQESFCMIPETWACLLVPVLLYTAQHSLSCMHTLPTVTILVLSFAWSACCSLHFTMSYH